MAIYTPCDTLLLAQIRDSLILIPYEYIVSTPQGKGQLILSELSSCSTRFHPPFASTRGT